MSEKDLPVLPRDERIETVEINGKPIQKHIYADGSYGIWDDNYVDRYFPDGKIETYKDMRENLGFRRTAESLPDGTGRDWYDNGQMNHEKLPDGTFRVWHENGQMEYKWLPDGTWFKYDRHGKMTYHATKGVEDTAVYLAKRRVAQKHIEKEDKLSEGKDERVVLPKMNKVEKAVEMLRAKIEAKKGR